MKIYKLTIFEQNGEKICDESFEAMDDSEAKVVGEKMLAEKNAIEMTHRVTSPSGRLLLFHS